MLAWQAMTSVPHLGYYHELGIADERSVPVQVSSHLSSINVAALNLSHLPAFFAIAWAWCWALRTRCTPKRAALLALLISIVFGVGNELSQLAVPYRLATPMDVASNVIGAALAVIFHSRLSAVLHDLVR